MKCLVLSLSDNRERFFLRLCSYLPGGGDLGSKPKDRKHLVTAQKDRNNEGTCATSMPRVKQGTSIRLKLWNNPVEFDHCKQANFITDESHCITLAYSKYCELNKLLFGQMSSV